MVYGWYLLQGGLIISVQPCTVVYGYLLQGGLIITVCSGVLWYMAVYNSCREVLLLQCGSMCYVPVQGVG